MRSLALLIFITFLSISLCAQNSEQEKISGNYGANIKVRANISGTITTGSISSKPPLNERGIQRVGVIVRTEDGGLIQKVGITVFENSKDNLLLGQYLQPNLLDSLFEKTIIDRSTLEFYKLSSKEKTELLSDIEKGRMWKNPEALARLNSLEEHLDGIILIYESDLPDFFTGSRVRLGSKGIYKGLRKRVYAYSGFYISIIDVKTGKRMKAANYAQASADYLPFKFEKNNSEYSEEQIKVVAKVISERHLNNVEESLRMFKVLK